MQKNPLQDVNIAPAALSSFHISLIFKRYFNILDWLKMFCELYLVKLKMKHFNPFQNGLYRKKTTGHMFKIVIHLINVFTIHSLFIICCGLIRDLTNFCPNNIQSQLL